MFCDNDASAYWRKPRPAYEAMLAAVESGRIEAIVTWHNDRLHRSPKELEVFIDLVERRRVHRAVVTGGDYDLTTPDGRLSARIVGAVARKESEDRSRTGASRPEHVSKVATHHRDRTRIAVPSFSLSPLEAGPLRSDPKTQTMVNP